MSKMIIFGKRNFLLKMSGLDPEGGRGNTIARISFSIVFVVLNLLSTIFLVLNFRQDIDQTLLIMPLFLAYQATIAIYFHLVINRDEFYALLDELQDIVQGSTSNYKIIKIRTLNLKLCYFGRIGTG